MMDQQLQNDMLQIMGRLSETFRDLGLSKSRPIIGGSFGPGQYSLCSLVVESAGLDSVYYCVTDTLSGVVIFASNESKSVALTEARKIIELIDPIALAGFLGRFKANKERERAEKAEMEREAQRQIHRDKKAPNIRSIPRRRQRIFDASNGACHYCKTALTLDGKWHIEHKMPRALMGTNEPSNLVASCVKCNLAKHDKTDIEFLAELSGVAATLRSAV